jgi:nucleotide-binding universal stress UspA family protein
MPFRTILAVVRDQDNAAAIFGSAFGLCDTPDCHVIGYHAADAVDVNPALRGPLLEEWTRKALDKRALVTREIHKAFTTAAAASRAHAEWREPDQAAVPDSSRTLAYARTADVIVISRKRAGQDFMVPDLTLEDLLLGSGRPVYVMPDGVQHDQPPRKVLVAWSDTPEATRAAYDALPLLKMAAGGVKIICPRPADAEHALPMATSLAEGLARHGVKVEVEPLQASHFNAGPAILAAATAFGADALVMGAWGHSRLREFVLGGATDTILRECPVPVLMSH